MSAAKAFQTLKTFFETRTAAKVALSTIKEGTEIGVVIGGNVECTVFQHNHCPVVENRAAVHPDIIFYIRPESVYIIANNSKDEIGDIGVHILKEVLSGGIQIKIPGGVMNILSQGYLEMLRKGGAPVMSFLAQHGFGSVPKIVSAIKSLKR